MRRNILAGPISVLFAASILAVSAASCAEPKKAETPTAAAAPDAAFGEKVRAYLIAHPEVIAEAIEALKTKQQAEAEASNAKAIAQNKAQLEHAVGDPSLGAGPVTVVEFFDYRCAYCKAAAPHIPDMVAKNSQIRLVFKEFPILTEVSEHAARAALAKNSFDLVVCDVRLPDGTGVELLCETRTQKSPPIFIMMSAWAF